MKEDYTIKVVRDVEHREKESIVTFRLFDGASMPVKTLTLRSSDAIKFEEELKSKLEPVFDKYWSRDTL